MLFRSCSHALASRPRFARVGALLGLTVLLTTTTGCFGSFPLTRTVYETNGDISDVEFHQTLAFWAMTLTLVYPGALVTDVIVMNTIEFWKPEPENWEESRAHDSGLGLGGHLYGERPDPPAAVTAPLKSASEPAQPDAELDASSTGPAFAPVLSPPGTSLPGSPTVPLPLPPLEPIFEDGPDAPPLALSQASAPALGN